MTALGSAPVFIVHSLAHAVAALEAAVASGREITLASAPDAGIYAGPGWFRELVAAARAAVPRSCATVLLDCGDDAGAVQSAIRAGIAAIVYTGPAEPARRLAIIAAERNLRLVTTRPEPAFDVAAVFFADTTALRTACAAVLG